MADKKLQKVTKLLEMEKNPVIETLKEIERVDFAIEETNQKIETIQADSEMVVKAINQLDQTKADKEDVAQQIEQIARIPGRPGNQGAPGKDGINGKDGKDGIDGLDGKDGRDGVDGKDGKDGKDGSPDTPDQVIEKIHTSKKLIKKEKIEGLSDLENKLQIVANRPPVIQGIGGGASGIRDIRAGQNISVSRVNEIYTIGLNYTPTDTDEKVKVSANDTTAKYQEGALNAGTGISIATINEGGNEQSQITNTAPDQTVSITDSGIATVTGTYPNFNIDVPATDLTNYFNKTADDTDDITDTATNRFTNDTDITRLANTSGTNTGDVSVTDSSEIDFTLTGQNITASLKSGSIDETKLDTSVNASLDLADTALQSFTETDPVFGASEAANFVAGDKSKLDGIEAGAEVNVNADWNAVTGDAVILNKPSIPSQYTDEMAQDAVGNAVGNGLDYDDTTGAISVDETELAHNSLGSKQGGTTGEYYHLTAAQHTVVGNTSGTNTGDQDLSGYAKLDGTNQPFTGNITIDKQEATLTLSSDTDYVNKISFKNNNIEVASFVSDQANTTLGFDTTLEDFYINSGARFYLQSSGNNIFYIDNTYARVYKPLGIRGVPQAGVSLDVYGQVVWLGSDSNNNRGTNTNKSAYIAVPTYTGGTNKSMFAYIDNYSGNNNIWIGGGASGYQAATKTSFIVAPTAGGTAQIMADITTAGFVWNENSFDSDFRIESDTDANNFFSDGGTNRIGIGTGTPGYKLDVVGDINTSTGFRVGGVAGASGTFTTADAKTVTVTNGIITSIV